MAQSQPEPELTETSATVPTGRIAKRVLLIGWEGATGSVLQPLLQSGRLANLDSLLQQGARLELTVPRPANAASAWTTLATGMRPHEHGVLHPQRPSASEVRLESVTRLDRRRAAIWNILSAARLHTHVVGWPITFPSEKINGVSASDRFAGWGGAARAAVANSLVAPAELAPAIVSRRVLPPQIDEITLAQLVPRTLAGASAYPQLAPECRAILARTTTLFRALRWCLSERPWDFAACVFPGIQQAHDLARRLAGNMPSASEGVPEIVAGCCEYHDLLLGQLLQQVGDDTHVVAVTFPAQNSPTSNTVGLAAIRGPGVRAASTTVRANVVDVTPTILTMLGVPYGVDMAGRPRLDLFNMKLQPGCVTSWEPSAETAADRLSKQDAPERRPAETSVDDSNVVHLVELGYIDPHDAAAGEEVRHCERVTALGRTISQLDAGLVDEAIAGLECLIEQEPDWHPARALLAEAYLRVNQRDSARQQLEWLCHHGNEQPHVYCLAAKLSLATRDFDRALFQLRCAGRNAIRYPGTRALEGDVLLHKGDVAAAQAAYEASCEQDGPTPRALDGLAAVNLRLGDYESAAVNALDALAADMQYPRAHYHLAAALVQLDRPREAVRALESWAMLEPHRAAPYRWMARVWERQLADADAAREQRKLGREVVRKRRALKWSSAAGASALSSRP